MLTFRLLGGIGLSDSEGQEMDALLRQPKHIALLAYLSLPRPGTWHRRDSVLAAFWPETDQGRARAALRSALYTLRSHLPDGCIRARGDEELSISPELIRVDAAIMCDSVTDGDFEKAVALYQGDLLPGIFIPDAPAFEKWLALERTRVNISARKAAAQLSQQLEQKGDMAKAIDAARQGYEMDPDDEAAARRWISLLDRAGDRSQAFAVYERFRDHMAETFGVRPSAETVALLDAVRTRTSPSTSTRDKRHEIAATPQSAPPAQQALTPHRSIVQSHSTWAVLLVAIAVVAAAVLAVKRPPPGAVPLPTPSRSLVVLPMQNETGDPSLDYLSAGIAEGIARRLGGLGGMRVRSAARAEWSDSVQHDMRVVGRKLETEMLLRTVLRKTHDSLEVSVMVVDTTDLAPRDVTTVRFVTNNVRDAESRIAANVAGAVFQKPMPEVPREPDQPVDPESYRLMLKGWYAMLANARINAEAQPREYGARDLFSKAVEIDPLNARAWSGLSSTWASLAVSGEIPFDEGFDRTSAAALHALAIDSLQGSAWANLAVMRALRYGDLSIGLDLIRKAENAEPSNPEIFLIKSSIFRAAHRYDESRDAIRVARRLDPLSSVYLNHEAAVEFCADRPDAALRIFQSELDVNPGNDIAVGGAIRALALLGRYDEAIALWERRLPTKDSLSAQLRNARGAVGYWELRHRQGRRQLASLESKGAAASPVLVILAQFAAGSPDSAYRAMSRISPRDKPALYRLSCMPAADEYKSTPQFKAAIARIGSLRAD